MENSEEPLPEKKYAQLPNSSLKHFVKAIGLKPISDDILSVVNENANFLLRCVVANAFQYTKNERRRILTTDDFNKSLEFTTFDSIHGYKGPQVFSYNRPDVKVLKKKNAKANFLEKETELNLFKIATSSKLHETVLPEIRFTWATVENKVCLPFYFKGKNEENPETPDTIIPNVLNEYFDTVIDTICSGSKEDFNLVLSDLQKNPFISSLLPKFTCFLQSSINLLCKNSNFSELSNFLLVIQAIVSNSYVYIGHQPYITVLTECILNCLVAPVNNYIGNHWIVRDVAAELLSKIYHDWASPVNKLCEQTLKRLENILTDFSKDFTRHYGAVIGIMAFGIEAIEKYLIPNMESYMKHLNNIRNSPLDKKEQLLEKAQMKSDAQEVYNVLLNVSVHVMLSHVRKIVPNPETKLEFSVFQQHRNKFYDERAPCIHSMHVKVEDAQAILKEQSNNVRKMYKQFYDYFGNPFKLFLPLNTFNANVNTPLKHEKANYFPGNNLIDESVLVEKHENHRHKKQFMNDLKGKPKKKILSPSKSDCEISFSDDDDWIDMGDSKIESDAKEENDVNEESDTKDRSDFLDDNDSTRNSTDILQNDNEELSQNAMEYNVASPEPDENTSCISENSNSDSDSSRQSENYYSNNSSNQSNSFQVQYLQGKLKIILRKTNDQN